MAPSFLFDPKVVAYVGPIRAALRELFPTCDLSIVCLLIVALLAYVPHAIRAAAVVAATGGYNLKAPRSSQEMAASGASPSPWLAQLVSRCSGAHSNMLEGYALFATAVLCALWAGVPKASVEAAALLYTLLRCAYIFCYVAGVFSLIAYMRSAIWIACIYICSSLLFEAAVTRGAV